MNEVYINIKEFGENSWLGSILYKRFKKDLISVDELLTMIEDLSSDVETLEDRVRDLEEDIEQNYRPIPVHEQYEVYDSDFI